MDFRISEKYKSLPSVFPCSLALDTAKWIPSTLLARHYTTEHELGRKMVIEHELSACSLEFGHLIAGVQSQDFRISEKYKSLPSMSSCSLALDTVELQPVQLRWLHAKYATKHELGRDMVMEREQSVCSLKFSHLVVGRKARIKKYLNWIELNFNDLITWFRTYNYGTRHRKLAPAALIAGTIYNQTRARSRHGNWTRTERLLSDIRPSGRW